MTTRAAIAILVAGIAAAGAAHADSAPVAEGLFADGVRLMEEHRYAEACAKFQTSLEYLDGLGTRGKLAECWEKLGRVASAWTAWREVAARAHRSGETARERVATGRAQALQKRLPYLTIFGPAIDGLAVTDDDVALDAAALGTPLPIDPGAHEVKASAPGRETYVASVTVGEGERREVRIPELAPVVIAVEPMVPSALAVSEPAAPPAGGNPRRIAGIAAVVAGSAAIVAGGVVAILAKSQWDGAFAGNPPHCDSHDTCDASGFADTDAARSKATIAGILVGGGAAVAITGAILWWTAPRDETAAPRAHLAPLTLPGGVGVGVAGGF